MFVLVRVYIGSHNESLYSCTSLQRDPAYPIGAQTRNKRRLQPLVEVGKVSSLDPKP